MHTQLYDAKTQRKGAIYRMGFLDRVVLGVDYIDIKKEIQWILGVCIIILQIYMSWLSLQEGYSLSNRVIAGNFLLVVLLWYGINRVESILRIVKGIKNASENNKNNGVK